MCEPPDGVCSKTSTHTARQRSRPDSPVTIATCKAIRTMWEVQTVIEKVAVPCYNIGSSDRVSGQLFT